jgi:hypothetical protein
MAYASTRSWASRTRFSMGQLGFFMAPFRQVSADGAKQFGNARLRVRCRHSVGRVLSPQRASSPNRRRGRARVRLQDRFHKTVLNEFYRVAFRKKVYRSVDELQADLDEWVTSDTKTGPLNQALSVRSSLG